MNHHFEFIRMSLHELSVAGRLGDTEVVCDDGSLSLNRLVLGVMFPELSKLIEDRDDYEVILPGFNLEKFNEKYKLLFVNDGNGEKMNLQEEGPTTTILSDRELNRHHLDYGCNAISTRPCQISDVVNENVKDKNCEEISNENKEDHLQKMNFTHHDGSKIVQHHFCTRCNKVYNSLDSFNNHKISHHEVTVSPRNLPCTWCEKSFISRRHLVTHEVTVHKDMSRLEHYKKDRITRCGLCGKLFMSYADYKVHILYHLKDRPDKENIAEIIVNSQFAFNCSSCESKFSTKEALDQHIIKFHLNPKGSVCDICKKSFLSLELCAKHRLTIHNDGTLLKSVKENQGVNIDILTCKACNKAFSEKDKLIQHEKYHLDPLSKRKHMCCHCPKSFPSPAARVIHERSHTGEKPFKCNFCGLGFAAKGNLNSHRKSHLNKKDYSCSFCGKGFNTKRDRKTHETHTHSNTRAFICDNCGESYKRVMNLKRHKRVCKISLQSLMDK